MASGAVVCYFCVAVAVAVAVVAVAAVFVEKVLWLRLVAGY